MGLGSPALVAACALLACIVQQASAYENSFFGAQNPFSGQPAGPVTHPKLACLNTVAPPPFNYRMRCATLLFSWVHEHDQHLVKCKAMHELLDAIGL